MANSEFAIFKMAAKNIKILNITLIILYRKTPAQTFSSGISHAIEVMI